MLLFSVGRNFVLFSWLMERLRALMEIGDHLDPIWESIIEVNEE